MRFDHRHQAFLREAAAALDATLARCVRPEHPTAFLHLWLEGAFRGGGLVRANLWQPWSFRRPGKPRCNTRALSPELETAVLAAAAPLERILHELADLADRPFMASVDVMPGMLVAACDAAIGAVRTSADFEPTCAWRRTASAAVARIARGRGDGDTVFWEGAIAATGHQAMRFARLARTVGGKRAMLDLLRDGHHTMPRRGDPFPVQEDRDVRLRIEDGVALLYGVLRLDGQPPYPRPIGAIPIDLVSAVPDGGSLS